ncbi:hypothetical protein EI74_0356 [Mycoplasma testudineum]|uniref:Uncharacterized protein n=1 Tax=Mycoplasma testudineum TaxID=244584 RepID=A0A4R6IFL6_9MOLU|nr:hypothetical protein [Mycoplasma testudineum]OYD26975.1 hypothetical protein CG473_01405 [Mycoplasma testudineum]TDO20521.1 hypothetical protein EI74_0356 [Mycoplasma testudineum]
MKKNGKNIIKNSKYIEHDKIENFKSLDDYTSQFDKDSKYEDAGYGSHEFDTYSSSEDYPSFETSEKYPIEDYAPELLDHDFDITATHQTHQPVSKTVPSSNFNFEPKEKFKFQTFDPNLRQKYSTQEFLTQSQPIPRAMQFTQEFGYSNNQNINAPQIYETTQYTIPDSFDYNKYPVAAKTPNNQYYLNYYNQNQRLDNVNYEYPEIDNFSEPIGGNLLPLNNNINSTQNLPSIGNNSYYQPQYQSQNSYYPAKVNTSAYQFSTYNTNSYTLPTPVVENYVDNTEMVDITNLHNYSSGYNQFDYYNNQKNHTNTFNNSYQNTNLLPANNPYFSNSPYGSNEYGQNYYQTPAVKNKSQTELSNLSARSRERIKNIEYLLQTNLISKIQFDKAKKQIIENDNNSKFKTSELGFDKFNKKVTK